ncbi:MAG: hypothetical protein QM589_11285 [Thermomicrobiales bacterium]
MQHLLAGHAVFEAEFAGEVPELPVDGDGVVLAVHAEDLGAAGGRTQETEDRAQGGRFARAVRAKQAEELPGAHRERDVVHGDGAAPARAVEEVLLAKQA